MSDAPEMPATPQDMPTQAAQAPVLGGAGKAPGIPGKLDMKVVVGVILVVAAIALGLVYFTQQQGTMPAAPAAPAPAPVRAPQAANASNSTIAINETPAPPKPPVDPFANVIPRNISDNIADGQFRVAENPTAPLQVYAIDDGYADAILVNKGGFNMLIDAGNFSPVDAFLQKQGVKRLNVVVATRDDPGAIGGMSQVLSNYQVDELWDNNVPAQGDAYAALLEQAAAEGITIKHPQAGDNMSFAGMGVAVLNPQKERQLGNPDVDAVVLKISSGGFCMLLLNPTVQDTENAIISTGESLRCDAVTLYKHGEGRPDPSLLIENYAKPKDAIISVGPNSDGLPSPTTLTRLGLDGTGVWSTENGTVVVTNSGLSSAYTIAYSN